MYGTTHLVHVHRGINGTVLRNHDMIGSWFTKLRIKALESCRSTPLSFGCGPRGVREGTSAMPTHLNFVNFIH